MTSRINLEQKLDHVVLKPLLRGAFKSTGVYRVELPVGMLLYKLTQGSAVSSRGGIAEDPTTGFATPWFSYHSLILSDARFGTIPIRGVADVAESSPRLRVDFRAYLRSRGAICRDWNAMTHLLIAELRRSAIGMMGACSGQPTYSGERLRQAHDEENISFIGGEQQFYLPCLHPVDVTIRRFGPLA